MNLRLLDKVIAIIINRPDLWCQSAWGWKTSCGTTFCLAGWVCVLKKPKGLRWANDGYLLGVKLWRGQKLSAYDFARAKLKLSWDDADYLFDSKRSLSSIIEFRNEWAQAMGKPSKYETDYRR